MLSVEFDLILKRGTAPSQLHVATPTASSRLARLLVLLAMDDDARSQSSPDKPWLRRNSCCPRRGEPTTSSERPDKLSHEVTEGTPLESGLGSIAAGAGLGPASPDPDACARVAWVTALVMISEPDI